MVHYILDGKGEALKTDDLVLWIRFMNRTDLVIDRDILQSSVIVTTRFLGLDVNYGKPLPKAVFETSIVGGLYDGRYRRYSTRTEAIAGHIRVISVLRDVLSDAPVSDSMAVDKVLDSR